MTLMRVLLVDDHDGFRTSARILLEAEGFIVVAEADDGTSAVAAAAATSPDLVLLDIQLPDMDGFEVVRRLTAAGIGAHVVLIASRDEEAYADRLARSPADGFVSKADLSRVAIDAIVGAGS
jgi:DNA-binding NarL/FixJ family response regulator